MFVHLDILAFQIENQTVFNLCSESLPVRSSQKSVFHMQSTEKRNGKIEHGLFGLLPNIMLLKLSSLIDKLECFQ